MAIRGLTPIIRAVATELAGEALSIATRQQVAAQILTEFVNRGFTMPRSSEVARELSRFNLGIPANQVQRGISTIERLRRREEELEAAGRGSLANNLRRSTRSFTVQQMQRELSGFRIQDIPLRSREQVGEGFRRTRFRYFFRVKIREPSGIVRDAPVPFDIDDRLSVDEAAFQLQEFLERRYPGRQVLERPDFRGVVRRY